ncbi:hypothetical protein C1X65_22440 [Pseudomonas sp. FW305-70]|nr:hypothetical protein C1X65_22440 [Pseudomonas sp. FW305-70]
MSGRRIAAMVVNDNAGELDKRGALESIASKLAPTVSAWARSFVGAGLPAMVVNDNAVNWINAARLSPSPASWLLQFQRGHGPLWELACQRWSSTITRLTG